MCSVADPVQEVASEGDINHGLGDVDAGFVVTHQLPPSGHPAEGSLDHPARGEHLEAGLLVGAAHDLDDDVEEGGLVHQLDGLQNRLAWRRRA